MKVANIDSECAIPMMYVNVRKEHFLVELTCSKHISKRKVRA